MTMVAFGLFALLATIATLHLYWAAGGVRPAGDWQALARTVVGTRNIRAMPSRTATSVVAVCIYVAAVWPLLWSGFIATPFAGWLKTIGMIGLAAVFLVRGAAGVSPLMRRVCPEEPFATLNRWFYSPLCLLIGAGFAYLLLPGQ